jgi:hypothetical protein
MTAADSSTATQAASSPATSADAEVCAQCGAERVDRSVGWCKKCGFYPLLGRCIELIGADRDADADADAAVETKASKPSAIDGIGQLASLTPQWVWKLSGIALLAAITALAGKVLTDDDTTGRLIYTLCVMTVAKLAVISAHVWAFFYAVTESDRLGVGDLIMRPIAVWSAALRDINHPKMWRRPAVAVFGIVAESIALLVLGGVPWSRVWELGPREPPKKELADSLDRVGKVDNPKQAPPAKPLENRQMKDCVIFGYLPAGETTDSDGNKFPDFSGLVLAADINDRLTSIGVISEDIPEVDRAKISSRLAALAQDAPVIPSKAAAMWLEPVLTCRISYTRMTADKKLESMKFVKLLGELPRRRK